MEISQQTTNAISNIYRFILQRDIGSTRDIVENKSKPLILIKQELCNSEEFNNLLNNKLNEPEVNIPKINYQIIKINDRAIDNTNKTINLLKNNFNYLNDIEFVNGENVDFNDWYTVQRQIKIDGWKGNLVPYEPDNINKHILGIIASEFLCWEYIIKNSLNEMLVLEDDIVLDKNFLKTFSKCYRDLPEDYDFFACFHDKTEHKIQDSILIQNIKPIHIGSNYICKSYMQETNSGFMLYSKKGAQKIMDAYRKYGIDRPIDIFLFQLSRNQELNGYSTFYSTRLVEDCYAYGTMNPIKIKEMKNPLLWSDIPLIAGEKNG
jgi:GR25 family glycosyltransferase involved in LPS biosynthesis